VARSLAVERPMFTTRPLYLQVRDALLGRITSGEWLPGNSLPNEIMLGQELGVSSGTVRKALDVLESERLLVRRQGRGTFVTEVGKEADGGRLNTIRNADNTIPATRVVDASLAVGPASGEEAERLHVAPGAIVFRVERRSVIGERRFMVEFACLPQARFPGLDEAGHPSFVITELAQRYRVPLGRATERISISTARAELAAWFGMSETEPLLLLERVVFDVDDAPVEWRRAFCRFEGEHYVAEIA
jgi:GntR family transcriptional regulator